MSEIKRHIEVRDFECPFCGNKQSEVVKDEIINENTGDVSGFGIDAWECKKCNAYNEMGLEEYIEEYEIFEEILDESGLDGLHQYCKYNTDDDFFMLTNFVKFLNQKRQFNTALDVASVIFVLDPTNPDLGIIIDNAETGIRYEKAKKKASTIRKENSGKKRNVK